MAQPLQVLPVTDSSGEGIGYASDNKVARVARLQEVRLADRTSLISPVVVRGAQRAADVALVAATGLLIAALYVPSEDLWHLGQYPVAILGTAVLNLMVFEMLRLYERSALMSGLRAMPRVVLGWTASLAILVTLVFFAKVGPEFSRVWLAVWFAAGAVALVAGRLGGSALTHKWAQQGRLNRRAVIYGSGTFCDQFLAALEADKNSDVRIFGVFDDRSGDRAPSQVRGYPNLGNIDDLVEFVRNTRVDIVFLTLPMSAEVRLIEAMRKIGTLPVDVRLAANATKLRLRPRAYSHIGDIPVIDLADKPITDWNMVAKWTFDKVIATLALIALSPLMIGTAIAIRLESRGPIFFRQKRYGFNNELIEVYKFRSMYTEKCDATASKLVTKDDPRVTRVGRIIRKTSIDELPQLINVLRGELSLVGPRPHALHAKAADKLYHEAVDGYSSRHRVKPGITGWAQINGWRGETDTEEKIAKRVEYDLYYIENWSLLLDLYILFRTPFALLKTDNAY
jgi:Undecaprenyl-phosphate glucose phosphotransferase